MGDPSEHAKLSPSKGYQWLHCTASIGLIEQLKPKNETSSFAHEGTVCHDIAANILTGVCKENMTNKTVEGVLITPELWAAIRTYVRRVLEVKESLPGSTMLIETKVTYSDDCWGTADTIIYTDSVFYVIDLKMGRGHEVYSDADQLKIYGSAGLKTVFGQLQRHPAMIICEIVQPRIKKRPCTTPYTFKTLIDWQIEVLDPAIESIKSGKTKFAPSADVCRWCLVAPCPTQTGEAVQLTGTTVKQLVEQPKPDIADPAALSADKVIPMYQKRGLLKTFLDALEKHVFTRTSANDPAFMEFFKIISGNTKRKFADPKAVEAFIVKEFEIAEDELYTYKLKSPAQMEALLTEKGKDITVLKPFITKPVGKPTLAPADSKKPAMSVGVENLLKSNPVVKSPETNVEDLLKANPVILAADMGEGPDASSVITIEKGTITGITTRNGELTKATGIFPEKLEAPIEDIVWNKRTRKSGIITRERGEFLKAPANNARSAKVRTIIAMSGSTIDEVAAKIGVEPKSVQNQINNINKRHGYGTYYDGNTGVYHIRDVEPVVKPEPETITITETPEIPAPPGADVPNPPTQDAGLDFL